MGRPTRRAAAIKKVAVDHDYDEDQDMASEDEENRKGDDDSDFKDESRGKREGGGARRPRKLRKNKENKASSMNGNEERNGSKFDATLYDQEDQEMSREYQSASDGEDDKPKKAKKSNKVGGDKPKRQKKAPTELNNPNMIKTSNKLIGEIENKDLYNSDDDNVGAFAGDGGMSAFAKEYAQGEELDLGVSQPKEKKEISTFLNKISHK